MDAPRTHSPVLAALSAGLIVLFVCLILLWQNPLVFWNDDYELSVLPVFADMARSWSEGQWPILSPYSWVCGNLAGEFQYGTFSVFINAAVILIWKFPLTFPQQAAALSIAHLFVLTIGAFLLGRGRGFSAALSIFIALIVSLNGWIICWGATDWFGALGAFTWLPWVWWALEKSLRSSTLNAQRSTLNAQSHSELGVGRWKSGVRRLLPAVWAAPFVYLLVTGGFPYTVIMLLLLIVWLSIRSVVETRNIFTILPMLVGVALGFGLSAPAWLALMDLVRGSARELQPASAHWQWLVPPTALPGLILPSWTVSWADFSTRYLPHTATELACGLVAPAAVVAGLILRGRMVVKQIKWELLLLLLVLLLCMIPTAGLFRWSFRWLPFVHLVLAICAAEVLAMTPRLDRVAITALVLVVLTAVAMWVFRATGRYTFPLVWIFIALAGAWSLSELLLRNFEIQKWTPAVITFLALLATYLFIPTNCGVPTYNFSQELLKPAPLDPARLYLSVYPWAELTYCVANKPQPVGQTLRPGSTSMWAGLHFINGYSPIRPAGAAREFATSIHGEINPEIGDRLLNEQAGSDGELALMGVDGIVVAQELDLTPQPASEWEQVIATDEGRVFHRRGAPLSRVRSVTAIDTQPNEQFVSASISQINDSRNWVAADVNVPSGDRPALLIFSRPYFRGYTARLSDQKLAVTSYRGLFPMVEIPPGAVGRLVLSYCPDWLVWGGSVAVACAIGLTFSFFMALRRTLHRAPHTPNELPVHPL